MKAFEYANPLSAEDAVHDLDAGTNDRAEFAAVDGFGDRVELWPTRRPISSVLAPLWLMSETKDVSGDGAREPRISPKGLRRYTALGRWWNW